MTPGQRASLERFARESPATYKTLRILAAINECRRARGAPEIDMGVPPKKRAA